jgi:soluble lytic murein transglycosylase
MYPMQFQQALVTSSLQAGIDPALVAAVICQESTFDPQATSAVGARGLMQLMLPTGRSLARGIGVKRLDPKQLFDPQMGLLLGTRYLKDLIGRFGGKVERALAAYNAGPHRVAIWNLAHPGISAEEFVDSIPYQETRTYVMTILAAQEQYRRIYALPTASAAAYANADGRP